ncbi:CRISPR-associated endonuclease Cas1 [Streptomyces sp. ME02-8801-2C]|uniref:CRISPR-associated endonuclease Cas1 n=1 Tax=Streptomyces sp. ME02-8801-2C TaxID=3028680 RepID=UPI0039F6CCBA
MSEVYSRESSDSRTLVVSGAGVSLNVHLGHLVISDGLGLSRRERRIPRVERRVKRIILAHPKGSMTLDAVKWCEEMGVSLVLCDPDGTPILATTNRSEDARLRRAQAFAGAGGPYEETGLHIVKDILRKKVSGQAANLREMGHERAALEVEQNITEIENAPTVDLCRSWEGASASVYWGAFVGTVSIPWLPADESKVPAHWQVFVSRASLTSGKARGATDPINAILNYCYRLAEIECVLACQSVGLDPQFGFLHLDRDSRNSLALDLLEILRPYVDRYVLRLIGEVGNSPREFTRKDFLENSSGVCRLMAPLTHELAENAVKWARILAPVVEEIAETIANAADGSFRIGKPTQDKILMRKPAGNRNIERKAPRKDVKNAPRTAPAEPISTPKTVDQIIPDDLWESASRLMPEPRQSNKADQRSDRRGVLGGAVCTEILGIPGRHLPRAIADRKTVRTHLRRWKASGVWDALLPIITEHPSVMAFSGKRPEPMTLTGEPDNASDSRPAPGRPGVPNGPRTGLTDSLRAGDRRQAPGRLTRTGALTAVRAGASDGLTDGKPCQEAV